MPQMSPMNWILLMFNFLIFFFYIMIIIYFMNNKMNFKKKMFMKVNYKKLW